MKPKIAAKVVLLDENERLGVLADIVIEDVGTTLPAYQTK
jgi:hypothetical protein